jgi:hypothetical protein
MVELQPDRQNSEATPNKKAAAVGSGSESGQDKK